MNELSPREAKVLRMRFGLDTISDHTLEEVGKWFDVTRERIRQLESKAMRKLMHPSRADKLRPFLEHSAKARSTPPFRRPTPDPLRRIDPIMTGRVCGAENLQRFDVRCLFPLGTLLDFKTDLLALLK